ncbi:N-formylglutamate amidohydrolase [Sphingobium sp. AN558]|uniref:N-formylglutamate amidohydrolase n=1 Tax=Sphingobium sp. AN558 TaxID=3133442 RepID=UPI0030C4675F
MTPAFHRFGPDIPISPVIISVPHAGRAYSDALLGAARVSLAVLRRLEDRWVDCLAHDLIASGSSVMIAQAPRACIDLNRHEREIDPVMITGIPPGAPLQASIKLRGGLGLIPRRVPGANELWRALLPWSEVQRRIALIHRPYHAALTRLMQAAREAHGHAILIDLHSMPPLPPAAAGRAAAQLVLGDRFGRSASARLMTLAADVAAGHGVVAAQNHPYPGDHLIERHGRPAHAMHALQLEVDRSLYLDAALDGPGPGLAVARAMITAIAGALAQELPRASIALAAE